MSSIDSFKRRSQRHGVTAKEKAVNEIRRNFDKQVSESPAGYEVQATLPGEVTVSQETRTIKCLINNVTLNDQRVLDEKYLHVAWNEDIEIGCYVYWQNSYWLLMFMEHNSVVSHRTFTMRRCNQVIKHRHNDTIWDIPVSIENLTMYSDGLADLKMTSQSDSKRHISYGSNPITRSIKIGHRVIIGNETVFRVTHINDFEYNSKYTGSEGLIKALVLSCSFVDGDDKENKIAYNETEVLEQPTGSINGDREIALGSINKYDTGELRCWFELEMVNGKQNYANLLIIDDYSCKVKVSIDSRYIGQRVVLKAYQFDTTNLVESIEIKITGV